MQYTKPPLSFEDLADLLISRGLLADKPQLLDILKSVSYYRLTAYLYPYRELPSDNFKDNTTFDIVWKHYRFDRQLRILAIDAIERVEVAVRTKLIHYFCESYGPFGYTDAAYFPNMSSDKHTQWIDELKTEADRSKETFMLHFKSKYGDIHDMPPLWMIGEVVSFGRILTMFNGVEDNLRKKIALDFNIPDVVLKSWLGTLNVIRNICAHHGRLWNRQLGYKPFIPRAHKYLQWHKPVEVTPDRIFAVLTILQFLLKQIAPNSKWHIRFHDLITRFPEVSLLDMGFPTNWQDCPIWRER